MPLSSITASEVETEILAPCELLFLLGTGFLVQFFSF